VGTRVALGVPGIWGLVKSWFTSKFLPATPHIPDPVYKKKCPELPVLKNYRAAAPDSFWSVFPFCPLPVKPEAKADYVALKVMLKSVSSLLTPHELRRGERVCHDLEFGSTSCQKSVLPPIDVPNTSSAFDHGEILTDEIASWVKAGIVAGPFSYPPMPGARSNPLMAVPQKGKVRPVINMSAPAGKSFNCNIDPYRLEKVYMSTALHFGYAVIEAGRLAKMSKFDKQKAYKIIPTCLEELRYQGFTWLGKRFFEKQGIFGAISAVCNFDRFGNTTKTLAIVRSSTPSRWVFRILDDTPIVAPAKSGICEKFSAEYIKVCAELKVELAPMCDKKEKAFMNETKGTVLGIVFNTETLSWSLPEDKYDDICLRILTAINSGVLNLKDCQKLVGSLNNFVQLCPFAKVYKFNISKMISNFESDENIVLHIPNEAMKDLHVLARIVSTASDSLPIPARPGRPKINSLVFISDAAGSNFVMQQGVRCPNNWENDRGVASISLLNDSLSFVCLLKWPLPFLNHARDGKGAFYGSKTTTLEMVGLLLPFLTIPSFVAGKDVILEVDNIALWHGWNDRGVKGDVSASILIRALHLVSVYLGCRVFVRHVERKSTLGSVIADCLSRSSTTTSYHKRLISRSPLAPEPPSIILDWLHNPSEDWDLAIRIVNYVEEIYEI